jgi:molybdenum cofactor biosynthesis protein MoaC
MIRINLIAGERAASSAKRVGGLQLVPIAGKGRGEADGSTKDCNYTFGFWGDVLGVARTAGILAAKRTPQLIPLCHPLRITGVDVTFSDDLKRGELTVEARVRTVDKTGVEMEALTAAAVAALTVYDMVKAVERGVTIAKVQLVEKLGGKSGHWRRSS